MTLFAISDVCGTFAEREAILRSVTRNTTYVLSVLLGVKKNKISRKHTAKMCTRNKPIELLRSPRTDCHSTRKNWRSSFSFAKISTPKFLIVCIFGLYVNKVLPGELWQGENRLKLSERKVAQRSWSPTVLMIFHLLLFWGRQGIFLDPLITDSIVRLRCLASSL